MNTPIQTISSKVANSTAPTLGSTTTFSNPRANAIAQLGAAIKTKNNIDRNDAIYNSLRKKGKSYGSGFGS